MFLYKFRDMRISVFIAVMTFGAVMASVAVSGAETESSPQPAAMVTGNEAGWVQLTGDDFLNVNCHADTWTWDGGNAHCTGQPVGVIRTKEPFKNLEVVCEWRHLKPAGNSGVFLWATEEAIQEVADGKRRLPQGIEVQVLDLGYTEFYEKTYQKKSDWFTCHGDVFPTGNARMDPFPPVAPDGRRSFPSQNLTLGFGNWNHYYIRAINGEVRLWVNGVEVSGGSNCHPSEGFLCLESEGSPIEFRNIKVRRLP